MPRYLLICLMLAILLLASSCAKRNTAYEDGHKLSLSYTLPVVGNPLDFNFTSEKLYIALDQGGLGILNLTNNHFEWLTLLISDDGSPTPLIKIRRISMVEEHKFLFVNETEATDKIHIVNATNPDSLKPVDSITGASADVQQLICTAIPNPTTPDFIEVFYCNGRSVNHGKYNGQLWMGSDYTITTPATASGIAIDDQYIYVAAQQRGLLIYNRATRQLISQLALPGEAQKLKVNGNKVYMACRQKGLQVVDITNPALPVRVGGYITSGYASDVDFYDNMVAISSGSGGLYLFNVDNPASPKLLHRVTDQGYINIVKFNNGKLVVGTRDNGVLFYDIN